MRYGPVGSKWNSRKYLRMHNESISRGLKAYHARGMTQRQRDVTALVAFIVMCILLVTCLVTGILKG